MAGMSIRSKGGTGKRGSEVLIEHQALQEERGRPFGPDRLCLFVDFKCSLLLSFPCDPFLPALSPAVVVSAVTPAWQFCAVISTAVLELCPAAYPLWSLL